MELTLTKENFDAETKAGTLPILIDFFADWCGPCRMLAPVVEKIADAYAGKLRVGKINVDEEIELAAAFGVQSIPSLFLLKDGEVIGKSVGYLSYEEVEDFIRKAL